MRPSNTHSIRIDFQHVWYMDGCDAAYLFWSDSSQGIIFVHRNVSQSPEWVRAPIPFLPSDFSIPLPGALDELPLPAESDSLNRSIYGITWGQREFIIAKAYRAHSTSMDYTLNWLVKFSIKQQVYVFEMWFFICVQNSNCSNTLQKCACSIFDRLVFQLSDCGHNWNPSFAKFITYWYYYSDFVSIIWLVVLRCNKL